ncbi:hypothetical protein B0O99DRAFT_334235 [Bisporella sp. PMI_857]|nr:hypothetical protein B0O99DRAFT_334235 [Bisporella sp. PMI_857]
MSTDHVTAERPACDFCHARKVKCDRRDPCANCVEALVECYRNRPRRRRGPRASRTSYFIDRISKAEESVATLPQHGGSASLSTERTVEDGLDTASSEQEMSADNNSNVLDTDKATTGPLDGLNQQTSEARNFLQQELESNTSLTQDRYDVLKKAIVFVDRISNNRNIFSANDSSNASGVDSGTKPQQFPPELLYMMALGDESTVLRQSFWPDHISLQTLEHMCLSLVEDQGDRQTLNHYRVCVYMKAITLISRLPRTGRSARLRDHLQRSKKQYEAEIFLALAKMDCLALPTLSLLQALLSGALFMQLQGDMSRSWTLTAFAARILVSLNYHVTDKGLTSNETDQNIHGALYSCYYLDKILSALLLRPFSLPKLKVKPADLVRLDPQLPLSAIVKTMVEFGQILEGSLDILFNPSIITDQVAAIDALVQEMYTVRARIEEQRVHSAFKGVGYEWIAMDFSYYAILTSIFRLNPSVGRGSLYREECLTSARKALLSLKRMQETIFVDANFLDEYPYFLTWTMLFFPLSPFFVLFCNVVYTSSIDDHALMVAITDGLYRFVDTNSTIAKLHKLFSAFLSLCHPLVHSRLDVRHATSSKAFHPGDATIGRINTQVVPPITSHDITVSNLAEVQTDRSLDQNPSGQLAEQGLDSNLMWELSYSQPWLGWIGSDFLTELDRNGL